MQFAIGQRVGDYEILQVLGAGGMGKVYKVRNVISDRVEAMKVLLPDLAGDPDLADRFLREIKVQAALSHANIAGLHTALRHENQLLMLMEFVEGTSIEALLESGPMPVAQTVDIVRQVLAALAFAHGKGVIHRDIKPANIMVTPAGEVKLMDFGIARMKADKRLTQTGRTLGSLYYMSPEQIRGEKELDARSDIYSLGITLYEMVTGQKPFKADSDFSIMAAHLQQVARPPVEVDSRVPGQLSEIIMMALAKEPAGRFQSADAFRNALGQFGGARVPVEKTQIGPPPAHVPSIPPPPPPAAAAPVAGRSSRGLYMAVGSLVTVVVLIVAAIQIPRFIGAKAQDPAANSASGSYTPAVPLSQVPDAQPTPTPAATMSAGQTQQPSSAVPTPAAVPAGTRVTARPQEQPAPVVRTQQVEPAPTPVPTPAPTPVQTSAPAATVAEPVPSTPAVNPAELEAVRDRFMKLAARVAGVQQKAKRIEAEQRSRGLGMRSDVVSGLGRMTHYMDETEAALRSGNAGGAKTALSRADRETETLERILGII